MGSLDEFFGFSILVDADQYTGLMRELSIRLGAQLGAVDRFGVPSILVSHPTLPDMAPIVLSQNVGPCVSGIVHPAAGASDGSSARTVLSWTRPSGAPSHTLQVHPAGLISRVARFLGVRDTSSGDVVFDAAFVAKSSLPSGQTVALLGERLRRPLLALARYKPGLIVDATTVELSVGTLLVVKDQVELALDALWHCVEVLCPDLDVRKRPGKTVAGGQTGVLPSAVCRVCGNDLSGQVVRCVNCERPHHAECWMYAGRCSTFGCGSMTSTSSLPGPVSTVGS